jgi:hypothetical protein
MLKIDYKNVTKLGRRKRKEGLNTLLIRVDSFLLFVN